MSDTRQALEEAFKAIYPEPSREWETWDGARIAEQREEDKASFMRWNDWRICKEARFRRFLDAEAWTDAAMMLVPEGWSRQVSENSRSAYATIVHVDVTEEEDDRVYSADGATGALALAQACLKARENGDG